MYYNLCNVRKKEVIGNHEILRADVKVKYGGTSHVIKKLPKVMENFIFSNIGGCLIFSDIVGNTELFLDIVYKKWRPSWSED